MGLALIGNPELLFLDEPTTGFDPAARHHAWDVIAGLRELGKTVFLTTHYMDEAEALADRVAVIVDGTIVGRGIAARARRARSRACRHLVSIYRTESPLDELPVAPDDELQVAGTRVRAADRATDRRARGAQPLGRRARTRARRARGASADPRGRLPAPHRRPMNDVGLTLTQLRYDQKIFWRNPMSVFFTVVQPLIFLVIFVSVFGNDTTTVAGHEIKRSTYYVPGILTLAIVTATFFNLTISLTRTRESGVLKRIRSTPLPPWCFLASRVGTSLVVAVLVVALLAGIGRVAYGVSLPTNALPGVLLALVAGVAAFACLAFAVTAFVPSVDAAAPIVNVIVLPLLFISGIFIPNDELPAGMQQVADIFPIKHLFNALLTGFDPATQGSGVSPDDLAVIAAWGLFGLVIALRFFRWTPKAT